LSRDFIFAVVLLLSGAVLGGIFYGKFLCKPPPNSGSEVVVQERVIIKRDTITTEKISTIERIKPVFSTDTMSVNAQSDSTLTEVVRLPVPVQNSDSATSEKPVPTTEKVPGQTMFTAYEAKADTVMFDSFLRLSVKFTSSIPLDTAGYFSIKATLSEREIKEKEIRYIEKEEGFFNKWLHFGLVIAPGYGIVEKKGDFFIGMGIMIGL